MQKIMMLYLIIILHTQVPPRPEPKPCTKPEPFQLESLVRHEEEMQREMEERERKEKEEAQMRIFRAQPVLKEYAMWKTAKLFSASMYKLVDHAFPCLMQGPNSSTRESAKTTHRGSTIQSPCRSEGCGKGRI